MNKSVLHLLRSRVFRSGSVVLILFLPTFLSSQTFRGSIRGKVTDPSGGLIPSAKVTAKNNGTGLARDVVTNQEGTYVFAELPAGDYTVTVNAKAFAAVAQNVIVNVGLDTTADFNLLKVEQQQDVINVTGEAPLVESTRDVLGEVVDQKLVADLPLNGRDFGKLVALVS